MFSDATISDRAILQECRNAANLIVHQDLDKRKLANSPNLFAFLPCLEMEEAPIQECCVYESECSVAKSVKTLPKIGEGLYGLAIQGVFGLDGKKKFKETNPNRYSNTLKLGLTTTDIFYWVINDHLYVSNPDTRATNIFLYPTEDVANNLLYPGEDCDCITKPDIESLCTPVLDKKFYFPDYRVADMNNIVEKNLLATYYRLPTDKTSDNKDDQAP
jgi:hypothetical protein